MSDDAKDTSTINRIDEIYQPTMVIVWAMANDKRRAMFRRRDMFATRAKIS
jgi:hypothetical protein